VPGLVFLIAVATSGLAGGAAIVSAPAYLGAPFRIRRVAAAWRMLWHAMWGASPNPAMAFTVSMTAFSPLSANRLQLQRRLHRVAHSPRPHTLRGFSDRAGVCPTPGESCPMTRTHALGLGLVAGCVAVLVVHETHAMLSAFTPWIVIAKA
jgi:hypothetical protein